ncbi:hypothetical protein FDH89_gp43 [Pseudomonas phage phiR18]|uniref:Uncharacterized protein n=2 Tax=Kochitakasuvirus TaxID=1982590 RepID=X5I385_BPKP2|nr:hypothetical protein FF13_gp47 [Pseudomonas phage KPP25]YP_009604343.1 hypothetical protein FDH89_gp43 [Pseudomonas phage phiR18]BAO58519.1 hypothetical protein [Pseudomonas phage KPP25]BAU16371.1 hypothetical protein [Pseudomonas phage phiR18]
MQKKPSKDAALNVLEFIANEALEAIAKFEAVQSDDNMSELFATRMRLKVQLDELKAARGESLTNDLYLNGSLRDVKSPELLMLKRGEIESIEYIKRRATILRKKLGISHYNALEFLAREAGFDSYRHALRELEYGK